MKPEDKDALESIRETLKRGLMAHIGKGKKKKPADDALAKDEEDDVAEGSPEEEDAESPAEEAAEDIEGAKAKSDAEDAENAKTPGLKEAMIAVGRYIPKKRK